MTHFVIVTAWVIVIELIISSAAVKIADLGLATCQTWSKLTREESRRRSRVGLSAGPRGGGTLSYMAPEHLESIHTVSTEKSDVYSFAIVVWVILTGQEPYASELGCPETRPSDQTDLNGVVLTTLHKPQPKSPRFIFRCQKWRSHQPVRSQRWPTSDGPLTGRHAWKHHSAYEELLESRPAGTTYI